VMTVRESTILTMASVQGTVRITHGRVSRLEHQNVKTDSTHPNSVGPWSPSCDKTYADRVATDKDRLATTDALHLLPKVPHASLIVTNKIHLGLESYTPGKV